MLHGVALAPDFFTFVTEMSKLGFAGTEWASWLRFGVREHAMGAIANGIALHNPGMIPYCATFFIFTGARPLSGLQGGKFLSSRITVAYARTLPQRS